MGPDVNSIGRQSQKRIRRQAAAEAHGGRAPFGGVMLRLRRG
jgi:hypothetical protein